MHGLHFTNICIYTFGGLALAKLFKENQHAENIFCKGDMKWTIRFTFPLWF